MNNDIRAKIERNHTLASALQMLIGFADRPECFGPVPSVSEQFTQLAKSYNVPREWLLSEYERVTGEKAFAASADLAEMHAELNRQEDRRAFGHRR
jgi:hypothetical protein